MRRYKEKHADSLDKYEQDADIEKTQENENLEENDGNTGNDKQHGDQQDSIMIESEIHDDHVVVNHKLNDGNVTEHAGVRDLLKVNKCSLISQQFSMST